MTMEARLFKFYAWLLAACILAGLFGTGCNPYVVVEPTPALASMAEGQQTSASPAATAKSPAGGTFTPVQYWQLAAQQVNRIIPPAITGGRAGY